MELKRKGYSRRADIPPAVLARLNSGELESATLAEGLAIDFELLAASVKEIRKAVPLGILPGEGVTRRMQAAGRRAHDVYGLDIAMKLRAHSSDTVRGWGAYVVAAASNLTLAERLALIQPFADDPHFGVREWAWLAVRNHIAADIGQAISILTAWTLNDSAGVRRFAVESTRPVGVWATQIPELKSNPALGLPLLEALKGDASGYVQDSVANWLNDAGKSRPDWVKQLCARWSNGASERTARIVQRAMRNLR